MLKMSKCCFFKYIGSGGVFRGWWKCRQPQNGSVCVKFKFIVIVCVCVRLVVHIQYLYDIYNRSVLFTVLKLVGCSSNSIIM